MANPPGTTVSVVVRTRDSAATVGGTIDSIRSQTRAAEVVVVDSGSSDRTLAVVNARADVVVEIPRDTFTFGGALNAGAAASSGSVVVALSSHSRLPHREWLATAAGHVDAGALAAFGAESDGGDREPTAPRRVDHDFLVGHPWWGMSNHASAWSASAWRDEPFDESLPAAEDREWSWRVTAGGGYVVADPTLVVPGDHRRSAGVVSYFRRLVKEGSALGPLRPLPGYSLRDAAADWLSTDPHTPLVSAASRARGRTRLVEVAARWRAGRIDPPGRPSTGAHS